MLDNTYSIMIRFAESCASPIGTKVYRSAREVALLLFTVRPVMSSQTVAPDPSAALSKLADNSTTPLGDVGRHVHTRWHSHEKRCVV